MVLVVTRLISAINKIIKLKGRNKAKGMIVIAASVNQLQRVIAPLNEADKTELTRYWRDFIVSFCQLRNKSHAT